MVMQQNMPEKLGLEQHKGWEGVSNCNPDLGQPLVDPEVESILKQGKWVAHAAWDHWGAVWLGGDGYAEEVWVYGMAREVMWAPSLEELVETVNDKYGWK